jgi:hypothetical protein
MTVGFLLLGWFPNEYPTVLEEFPAYSSVLLRLAFVNLRTVRHCYSTSQFSDSSGAGISAALCMLPCSPDYIIRLVAGGLAYSL